jgi:hypothetical protein
MANFWCTRKLTKFQVAYCAESGHPANVITASDAETNLASLAETRNNPIASSKAKGGLIRGIHAGGLRNETVGVRSASLLCAMQDTHKGTNYT